MASIPILKFYETGIIVITFAPHFYILNLSFTVENYFVFFSVFTHFKLSMHVEMEALRKANF